MAASRPASASIGAGADVACPAASERGARVAIIEPNRYHEEIVFALASAQTRMPGADGSVYATENRGSRQFFHDDLAVRYPWRPFAALADGTNGRPPFDLVLLATFPSATGQRELCGLLDHGARVFALVHDIDYFACPDGAEADLLRWPNLTIGYPGVVPARPTRTFPARVRDRIVRFMPVIRMGRGCTTTRAPAADHERAGVALPGSIEFTRRDFTAALTLAAQSELPLRIFGRSRLPGDGAAVRRALNADRRRLFAEIARVGATRQVSIGLDLPCSDFYRTIRRCRFVAIMPVSDAYVRGKLTGAVTAALSCGVPMLATPTAYAFYTRADPATFTDCMVPFDPPDPRRAADAWQSIVRDTPAGTYEELCRATVKACERLLEENVAALTRVLSRSQGE